MCIPALAGLFGAAGAGGAVAGAAAGGIGTALQLVGGLVTGLSQMANAQAMADAAKRNAEAAHRAALETLETGREESDLAQRRGAQQIAANMVAMAANGRDVTDPNALEILDDSQEMVTQDAFRIRENARRAADAQEVQSANYAAEAAMYSQQAAIAPISTLLSVGAKVTERYAPWVAGQTYPGTSATIMGGGYY